jgi:DNA repair exonuclease SbcCD nuclease subunit
MSVSIMVIGDPHSKRSNQAELTECASKIAEQITKNKPNAVVILGDLANDHEKLYLTALNGIVKFLATICDAAQGAKVYYIIGNHDAIDNKIFLTDDHAFNAFKRWQNLVIVDTPMRLKSQSGFITMCPYVPPSRFVEALDTIGREKWMESSVIFCHQEFAGAMLGAIPSKAGDEWKFSWPQIVSGHIHTKSRPQNNVLYVGAPYDINFGDEGEKGIHIVTIDTNSPSSYTDEFIDLGMPRKITIAVKVSELKDLVLPDNAWIRLYVSGTTQEFAKLKASEFYTKLSQRTKVIPCITDPIKTVQNVQRKGYLELLKEACKKENNYVSEALEEIAREGSNSEA